MAAIVSSEARAAEGGRHHRAQQAMRAQHGKGIVREGGIAIDLLDVPGGFGRRGMCRAEQGGGRRGLAADLRQFVLAMGAFMLPPALA